MLGWVLEPGEPDVCNCNSLKPKYTFCLPLSLNLLRYNFHPCSKILNYHKGQTILNLDPSVLMSGPFITQLTLLTSITLSHTPSQAVHLLVLWAIARCSPHYSNLYSSSATEIHSILQTLLIHLEPSGYSTLLSSLSSNRSQLHNSALKPVVFPAPLNLFF